MGRRRTAVVATDSAAPEQVTIGGNGNDARTHGRRGKGRKRGHRKRGTAANDGNR